MMRFLKTALTAAALAGAATYAWRSLRPTPYRPGESAKAPPSDEIYAEKLTDTERRVLLDELGGQL